MTDTLRAVFARHLKTIGEEVSLTSSTIQEGKRMGFRLHNLASPCERLTKYWGEKYKKALNLTEDDVPLTYIERVAEVAREAQEIQDEYEKKLFELRVLLGFFNETTNEVPATIPERFVLENGKVFEVTKREVI